MPQSGDPVAKALAGAKSVGAHAESTFPSSMATAVAPTKPVALAKPAPVKPAPTLGEELAVKKTMVGKAQAALPKMHNGGPVMADGGYQLKAGEHVLTAPEAAKARKHAIMASGMKSLAKPGKVPSKKAKE